MSLKTSTHQEEAIKRVRFHPKNGNDAVVVMVTETWALDDISPEEHRSIFYSVDELETIGIKAGRELLAARHDEQPQRNVLLARPEWRGLERFTTYGRLRWQASVERSWCAVLDEQERQRRLGHEPLLDIGAIAKAYQHTTRICRREALERASYDQTEASKSSPPKMRKKRIILLGHKKQQQQQETTSTSTGASRAQQQPRRLHRTTLPIREQKQPQQKHGLFGLCFGSPATSSVQPVA